MATLAQHRERFDKITERINRPGLDNLVKWLETTDFFSAPASSNFHGNYEGGLVEHCIHVVEMGLVNLNYTLKYKPELEYLRESVMVVGLFHDLCKINIYKRSEKWTKDDVTNKWKQYMGYKVEDPLPIGHGEKSLYYIIKHMELKDSEAMAIRWHMSTSEAGTQIAGLTQYSYNQAWEHPLVKIMHIADAASILLAETIDYKAQAR